MLTHKEQTPISSLKEPSQEIISKSNGSDFECEKSNITDLTFPKEKIDTPQDLNNAEIFHKILNKEIDNSDKSFRGFILALIKIKLACGTLELEEDKKAFMQPEIIHSILNTSKKLITSSSIFGKLSDDEIGILIKDISLDVIMKATPLRQYISLILKEISKKVPHIISIKYGIYPIDAVNSENLLKNLQPI